MIELHFNLPIEDDWPPVAVEGLPCSECADGYRVEVAPLFVKDLSCGDVISVSLDEQNHVSAWHHVHRSGASTIWLLRMATDPELESVLAGLRHLNCNTVSLQQFGCYSVNVPPGCNISDVDACLARLDESCIAVAYPSFRHDEP